MIITSKFKGECRVCSKAFQAGTKIEWIRGVKPAHVSCAVERMINPFNPKALYEAEQGARTDDDDYGRALAFSEGF